MAIAKLPGGVEDITFGMGTEQQVRQFGVITITQVNASHIPFTANLSIAQELTRQIAVDVAFRIDLDNKAYKTDVFAKTEHLIHSEGPEDAGKPVVTDADGRLSNSLIGTGNYVVGPFTPTLGAEYPDTTGHLPGAWWYIEGLPPEGYVFTTGDLIGRTAINGLGMFLGQEEWILNASILDPRYYYLLDGTNPITGNFAGGGFQFKNAIAGTEEGDLIEFTQLATRLSAYLLLVGGTVTGQIKGIPPVAPEDLTRRDFVEGLIDGVYDTIDDINSRIDGIDTRIDGIDDRIDGVDDRIEAIEISLAYPTPPIITPALVSNTVLGREYTFNIVNWEDGLEYTVSCEHEITQRIQYIEEEEVTVGANLIVSVLPFGNQVESMVIPLLFTVTDGFKLPSAPAIARLRLVHPGLIDILFSNTDFALNAEWIDGFGEPNFYSNTDFDANEHSSDGYGDLRTYSNADFLANVQWEDGFSDIQVYSNIDLEAVESFNDGFTY